MHLPLRLLPVLGQSPCLAGCRATKGAQAPKNLSVIKSPLSAHLPAWQANLSSHPDKDFATVVMDGLQHGFRVGFDHSGRLRPAHRNMPSAEQHPEVIDRYLEAELTAGRILGPFSPGSILIGQINRLGVVPKGHTSGKWRLITDLSFPEGASVNDGIDSRFCSIQYTSVDKIAKAAQSLGAGTLMAKLDVRAAYRLVPVHPDDRVFNGAGRSTSMACCRSASARPP